LTFTRRSSFGPPVATIATRPPASTTAASAPWGETASARAVPWRLTRWRIASVLASSTKSRRPAAAYTLAPPGETAIPTAGAPRSRVSTAKGAGVPGSGAAGTIPRSKAAAALPAAANAR
jgi:hypothetical protein